MADYLRPPDTLDALPPEGRLADGPEEERVGVETLERVGVVTLERVGAVTLERVGVDTVVRGVEVTALERVVGVVVRLADPGKLVTVVFGVRFTGVTVERVLVLTFVITLPIDGRFTLVFVLGVTLVTPERELFTVLFGCVMTVVPP